MAEKQDEVLGAHSIPKAAPGRGRPRAPSLPGSGAMARDQDEVLGAHSIPQAAPGRGRPRAPSLPGSGAMAGDRDEDLQAHFHALDLPPLLRKLHLTEEDSLPSYIELHKKKQAAQQVQKALEEAREDFKERMEAIVQRWRKVHEKQAQLKADMETSGKALQEIEIRALEKARKEREERMQTESELVRAKEILEALEKQHQEFRDKVQKFSIFKEHLEDMVKVSPFENTQELIDHYNILMSTHKELLQSQQEYKEMSEQWQVLLNQYMAEKEAEMRRLKNERKELQLRFDQAQKDALQLEAALADIQNETTERDRELGAIKLTVLNLYQHLSVWRKADLKVSENDSLKQLDKMQQFFQDFAELSLEEKQEDGRNSQGADLPSEQ